MKIGIIGAGKIGGTLTRRLTTLGHDVRVANSRGPETLVDLAGETGATATTTEEALSGAELVIVAIPVGKVLDLPAGAFERRAPGAAIVDTGNYYSGRDGRIDAIEHGLPESRWVEQQIGQPVVKAFNTIAAPHLLELGRPAGEEGRIALPVAGDEDDAKQVVMEVVEELGFDAVDAGGLDESWRQQPGTPGYGTDLDVAALRRALADASPGRSA
jgi:8-hydroxy-5-deazaflavin:NADPH oxidoreductase